MGGTALGLLYGAAPAQAMHIMEGFLPLPWALFWGLVALPFWVWGWCSLNKIVQKDPQLKLLLGLVGAFCFVLSALKIPALTGSSSHPTGTALGAMLFGPAIMAILGTLVLLFQALLLAHGGLTTLGANAVSMAIVGPWVAYGVYQLFQRLKYPRTGVFWGAVLGNLSTYGVTALQLALAFPAPGGGVYGSLAKFLAIFAPTQVPLALSEGLLTLWIWHALTLYAQPELARLPHGGAVKG